MRTEKAPNQYTPLALAYIGDAVYEIYVRTRVLDEHPDMPAHQLHVQAVQYVKAHAQSHSMLFVEPILSEEERTVYKRGRNAKSATMPKNADMIEYKRATGFEALIGYLYLDKQEDRLVEVMSLAYENAKDY